MTYAPVEAVPEAAGAPAAPAAPAAAGTLTGAPGLGGSLPDGVPVEPAAAGVGVAVTVE